MSDSGDHHQPSWIDLKIPLWGVIILCLGLLGQTATLIMWGAKMDARVAAVEAKVTSVGDLRETVARVDERTRALVDTVDRIDRRIDGERIEQ